VDFITQVPIMADGIMAGGFYNTSSNNGRWQKIAGRFYNTKLDNGF
jgi:hypothetical protein